MIAVALILPGGTWFLGSSKIITKLTSHFHYSVTVPTKDVTPATAGQIAKNASTAEAQAMLSSLQNTQSPATTKSSSATGPSAHAISATSKAALAASY